MTQKIQRNGDIEYNPSQSIDDLVGPPSQEVQVGRSGDWTVTSWHSMSKWNTPIRVALVVSATDVQFLQPMRNVPHNFDDMGDSNRSSKAVRSRSTPVDSGPTPKLQRSLLAVASIRAVNSFLYFLLL